jgi:hypothetical protein
MAKVKTLRDENRRLDHSLHKVHPDKIVYQTRSFLLPRICSPTLSADYPRASDDEFLVCQLVMVDTSMTSTATRDVPNFVIHKILPPFVHKTTFDLIVIVAKT